MTSSSPRNTLIGELVQLLPIVSFALPIIVNGQVNLQGAGSSFALAAFLWVPVTAFILWKRQLLNPILTGAGLWLCLGAAAFNLPIAPVAAWMVEVQAFALFLAIVAVALYSTLVSRHGYVACRSSDARWLRRASLFLLALTAGALLWAWVFRQNIRLGGGLPFIVLNVARRVLGRRAPPVVVAGA